MYKFKYYKQPEILKNHLNLGGENPAGEKLDVTSLYFTRNGKPVLPVMGEFHFSRYDRNYWYEELCKMKAGGITVVSTYVFWIYHEEIEGEFDFTGDNDLRAFILECKKAGLEALIRIGLGRMANAETEDIRTGCSRNLSSCVRIIRNILKKYVFIMRRFLNKCRGFSIRTGET
jgi:hypothetical protein